MKQEVYKSDFIDAFRKMGRYEDFGYNALSALFDFLNSQEKATGEEMMLDVIALCCDYTKYDSIADIASDYENIAVYDEDKELDEDAILEQLKEYTTVIKFDGGYIIQAF